MAFGLGGSQKTVSVKVNAQTGGFKNAMAGATSSLMNFKVGAAAATAAVGALAAKLATDAVQAASKFEEQMVEVAKVTSPEVANEMSDAITNMAEDIPLATKELSSIAAAGGRLGVEGVENLKTFTRVASEMGVATDIAASQAGESFARIAKLTKTPISEIRSLGDAVNALSNSMAASASDIVDAMLRSSGALKNLGLQTDAIVALNAALREVSASSRLAGTQARRMAQELMEPKAVKEIADAFGMTAIEFRNMIEASPLDVLDKMVSAMRDNGEQARNLRSALSTTSRQALVKLTQNYDAFNRALKDANEQMKNGGSLAEEYGKASDTFRAELQKLQNTINNVFKAAGKDLLPALKEIVEQDIQPLVSDFADWVEETDALQKGMEKVVNLLGDMPGKVDKAKKGFADWFEQWKNMSPVFGQMIEAFQLYTDIKGQFQGGEQGKSMIEMWHEAHKKGGYVVPDKEDAIKNVRDALEEGTSELSLYENSKGDIEKMGWKISETLNESTLRFIKNRNPENWRQLLRQEPGSLRQQMFRDQDMRFFRARQQGIGQSLTAGELTLSDIYGGNRPTTLGAQSIYGGPRPTSLAAPASAQSFASKLENMTIRSGNAIRQLAQSSRLSKDKILQLGDRTTELIRKQERYIDVLQALGIDTSAAEKALQKFKDQVGRTTQEMGGLQKAAKSVWQTIESNLSRAFNDWVDSMLGVGQAAKDSAKSLSQLTDIGIPVGFKRQRQVFEAAQPGQPIKKDQTAGGGREEMGLWERILSDINWWGIGKNVLGSLLGGFSWGDWISKVNWGNWLGGVANWLGTAWQKLSGWVGGAWQGLKNLGGSLVSGIGSALGGVGQLAGKAVSGVGSLLSGAAGFAGQAVAGLGTAAAGAFGGFQMAEHVLKPAREAISGVVKGGMNMVEGALDTVGGWFGFADGGIVTRPTLGMIGEAGTEAVMPLDKLSQYVGGGEIHVHVGSEKVGKIALDEIQGQNKRLTGSRSTGAAVNRRFR